MKKFQGSINQINIKNAETNILGWLWDREHPDFQCQAAIILDGKVSQIFDCSLFREDLKENKIGDGCHAFNIRLANAISDKEACKLQLHPIDKNNKILSAVVHAEPNIIDSRSSDSDINVVSGSNEHQVHDYSAEIDRELQNISNQGGGEDEAYAYLLTLLKKHPENYSIHHKIGDYYLNLQRYQNAIKYFSLAIELNSNALWSYHNLSVSYAAENNWTKAEELIQIIDNKHAGFWQDNHNNYLVQFHKANRLANQNDVDKAIQCYHLAYQLNPNSIDCLYSLSKYFVEQDKVSKYMFLLGKLLDEPAPVLDMIIEKHISEPVEKDPAKLLSKYQKLLWLAPRNFQLHEQIKYCRSELGEEQDATESKQNTMVKNYKHFLTSFDDFLNKMESELKNV